MSKCYYAMIGAIMNDRGDFEPIIILQQFGLQQLLEFERVIP